MQIVPLIPIAAVLAWILYRRVRQHTGKQAVRPISMVIQMILLCAVAIIVIAGGVTNANLEGATIGAVIGCALALYALHLTRIERAAEGLFHSGNAYIGLGVSMLLVVRIGYRVVVMAGTMQSARAGTASSMQQGDPLTAYFNSPSTMGLFFAVAAYYLTYYTGLLLKARGVARLTAP